MQTNGTRSSLCLGIAALICCGSIVSCSYAVNTPATVAAALPEVELPPHRDLKRPFSLYGPVWKSSAATLPLADSPPPSLSAAHLPKPLSS